MLYCHLLFTILIHLYLFNIHNMSLTYLLSCCSLCQMGKLYFGKITKSYALFCHLRAFLIASQPNLSLVPYLACHKSTFQPFNGHTVQSHASLLTVLLFLDVPGFVLIWYNKIHRHGNDCHEGRLYSQFPRNRRHGTQCRAIRGSIRVSQKVEEVRKIEVRTYIIVSVVKAG